MILETESSTYSNLDGTGSNTSYLGELNMVSEQNDSMKY